MLTCPGHLPEGPLGTSHSTSLDSANPSQLFFSSDALSQSKNSLCQLSPPNRNVGNNFITSFSHSTNPFPRQSPSPREPVSRTLLRARPFPLSTSSHKPFAVLPLSCPQLFLHPLAHPHAPSPRRPRSSSGFSSPLWALPVSCLNGKPL